MKDMLIKFIISYLANALYIFLIALAVALFVVFGLCVPVAAHMLTGSTLWTCVAMILWWPVLSMVYDWAASKWEELKDYVRARR